jgi:hypothetical protein
MQDQDSKARVIQIEEFLFLVVDSWVSQIYFPSRLDLRVINVSAFPVGTTGRTDFDEPVVW